jgi:hypothetical protein
MDRATTKALKRSARCSLLFLSRSPLASLGRSVVLSGFTKPSPNAKHNAIHWPTAPVSYLLNPLFCQIYINFACKTHGKIAPFFSYKFFNLLGRSCCFQLFIRVACELVWAEIFSKHTFRPVLIVLVCHSSNTSIHGCISPDNAEF